MSIGAPSRPWVKRKPRLCGQIFATIIVAAVSITIPFSAIYALDEQPEYVLKTAFIYNFLKFTQWPNGTFAKPDSPIVVCTAGIDPYGGALNVLTSKHIDSHPIALERLAAANVLNTCNAVIVSGQGLSQALAIIASLKSRPVLTIGDSADFASSGSVINLVNVDRQIRFQINVGAARHSGLSISSQLLKIAIVVDEPK
jgi:hypothetical protein